MTPVNSPGSITKNAYEQLIDICRNALPIEACGLVAISPGSSSIDIVIPIRNVHDQPGDSFSFDPKEWTASYYDMQHKRQQLVGFFHSHPHTEAVPSNRDSSGFLPSAQLSYWIISLMNKEAPQVQPYLLVDGAFQQLNLIIE